MPKTNRCGGEDKSAGRADERDRVNNQGTQRIRMPVKGRKTYNSFQELYNEIQDKQKYFCVCKKVVMKSKTQTIWSRIKQV